jgi:hypothetical protein
MPALICHYLHAQNVLKAYIQNGGAPVDEDAFLWGAQGPDFLYTSFSLSKKRNLALRKLGCLMHEENPLPLFCAMREYMIQHPENSAVRSYFLGFLCHYSLDRTCHPFVYAQIEALKSHYPKVKDTFLHGKIETSLDVILLRYESEMLPTEFNLKKAYPNNQSVEKSIASLYASILQNVYQSMYSEKEIMRVEKDCRFVTGLQNDRTGLKKQFFSYLERKHKNFLLSCFFRGIMEDDDLDYANILSSSWRYPPNSPTEHTESFLQLFESSINESLTFLKGIDQKADFAELFGATSFS